MITTFPVERDIAKTVQLHGNRSDVCTFKTAHGCGLNNIKRSNSRCCFSVYIHQSSMPTHPVQHHGGLSPQKTQNKRGVHPGRVVGANTIGRPPLTPKGNLEVPIQGREIQSRQHCTALLHAIYKRKGDILKWGTCSTIIVLQIKVLYWTSRRVPCRYKQVYSLCISSHLRAALSDVGLGDSFVDVWLAAVHKDLEHKQQVALCLEY